MALAHEAPFQWLQALEQTAKARAQGLPRRKVVQKLWRGVSFRLADTHLLAPLTDIREVLHYPKTLARVPGAKNWVQGIANIRGLLMPVIDLKACLGQQPIVLSRSSRMLIINQVGMSAGVLVDEVLGIQHFPVDILDEQTRFAPNEDWVSGFASGTFSTDERVWTVFDMLAFSQSKRFMDAAL